MLSVVGFHAFPGYLPGGFLGVDVFFVISGYLITGLLLRERQVTGTISIARFYVRRVRRLFPALLLVIAATVTAGYFLLFAHEFARLTNHVWASLFFVENLLLASETGYFDAAAYSKPLLHFWSLAVEEQFYIVWPLALLFLARTRRAAGNAVAVVFAVSLAITLFGKLPETWQFYSPLTRAWELAAGGALAWLHAGRGNASERGEPWLSIVSGVALAVLGAAILLVSKDMRHPGLVTIAPVAATIILLASGPSAFANKRLLALKPAIWIGLISYPLYLWHWPLLSYLSIVSVEERGPALCRLALVLLSVALAAATYVLVERPIRFDLRSTRSSVLLIVLVPILVACTQSSLYYRQAGTNGLAAVVEQQLEGVSWRYLTNDLCRADHGTAFTAFCIKSRPGSPEVLLFGDSYANHLYPGLAVQPEFAGDPILSIGTCEVSQSFPAIYDDCAAQWALLERLPPSAVALVANQWPLFDAEGRMSDLQEGDPGAPADYPDRDGYAIALDASFARIAQTGVTTIIVGPKPELGYDMADCYGRPLRSPTQHCQVERSVYEEQVSRTTAVLQAIAAKYANVHFFDQASVFCEGPTCDYRRRDGAPLLRDDNGHLSQLGSELTARRLLIWAAGENLPLP